VRLLTLIIGIWGGPCYKPGDFLILILLLLSLLFTITIIIIIISSITGTHAISTNTMIPGTTITVTTITTDKSWWNDAAKPHISVDLLCGTTATELKNPVWCNVMHHELNTFSKESDESCEKYEDSIQVSLSVFYSPIVDLQQTVEGW